jgi:hypothetical protein
MQVLNEYHDIFPEELPVMLPDHDIEFIIELLPGTALYTIAHIGCPLHN